MTDISQTSAASRTIIYFAAFVIVIAGLKQSSDLIIPFLLSIFIAIICEPPIVWLQRKKVPFFLALIIVISFIVLTISIVGALVGSSFNEFSTALPLYEERLTTQVGSLLAWLNNRGFGMVSTELNNMINPAMALKLVGRFANGISGVLTNIVLILITVIFLLLEAEHLPGKIRRIMKSPDNSISKFRSIALSINRYLGIKTLTSIATGILVSIGLTIIGVDFAIVWGVLAFFLNFIPNIGSILAAIPAVLLAWLQLGPVSALWACAVFLITNNFIGNFVEPKFMGKGLGLSALVVFLSLIFWGWVLGSVGMFLSVPLTIVVKIALENDPQTRWFAILLGGDVGTTTTANKVA